jgi:peptide/nickel transport system permease protein
MSTEIDTSTGVLEAPPRVSGLKRFLRVFFSRKIVIFGVVVIMVLIITAIFAPLMAPYSPIKADFSHRLLQPNSEHWLGTDNLGRDVLSRVIYGTRVSLIIGFLAVGISAAFGMALGLAAGYFGRMTNAIIMRFIDSIMAFPGILLALIIASLLGGGLRNVVIALGIGLVPGFARLMHGQVLSVKENDYIMACRSMGAGNLSIMLRHMLPNCFPTLIVAITMLLGMTVLAEAGLSFLGVGIEPPTAAWGSMVSDGYRYLSTNPMLSFAPGVAIMLLVFAFNMVGDGLRDALDPRLRGIL